MVNGKILKAKNLENELIEKLKTILDPENNFAKPLSDFWKGCSKFQCPFVYGHYGIWLSGEGGSTIDGEHAAYYYDYETSHGHTKLRKFMKENGLKLRWYDCATPILIFENDEI